MKSLLIICFMFILTLTSAHAYDPCFAATAQVEVNGEVNPNKICIRDITAKLNYFADSSVETVITTESASDVLIASRIKKGAKVDNGYEITYELLKNEDNTGICEELEGYKITIKAIVHEKGYLVDLISVTGEAYSTPDNCHTSMNVSSIGYDLI